LRPTKRTDRGQENKPRNAQHQQAKTSSQTQGTVNQEQAQRKKAPNHAETDARRQHMEELGDFTTTLRLLPISGLATVIGVVCAVLALLLLRPIGL